MSTGVLLNVEPSVLKFPLELKKQSSRSMKLINKTDKHAAFKVKTTNPRNYCVRPTTGVVSPRSTCHVTIKMQAQNEAPYDMRCKDKFFVQTVYAADGAATTEKIKKPEMFSKGDGKVVEEFKLRVL
ncbi:hypothetical protein TIFTF001_020820 [Ficus carica]|uniref:MSP domain-containing protein n=1 Tax=Ficus carica TaxID=3494 RepID=A0AA88A9D7_FICCA|nr:hypothetical protein TIFTF001_020820 [Ficus carica]